MSKASSIRSAKSLNSKIQHGPKGRRPQTNSQRLRIWVLSGTGYKFSDEFACLLRVLEGESDFA